MSSGVGSCHSAIQLYVRGLMFRMTQIRDRGRSEQLPALRELVYLIAAVLATEQVWDEGDYARTKMMEDGTTGERKTIMMCITGLIRQCTEHSLGDEKS